MISIDHTVSFLSDLFKPWAPIIAAGGFLYTVYHKARKGVSAWADKLLHNHMEHLQSSLDRIDSAQKQQVDHLCIQTEQLNQQTVLLGQIADDLRPQQTPARKSRKIKN